MPGHQAEQPVKAIVAHHAQSAVALDAAFRHKTGAKAAIVLAVAAAVYQGQHIADIALVVAMQHNQVVEVMLNGVLECHFMAAAQAIVLVVAQQADRGLRVGLHPALHGGFGAVGGAVIDHDALGDHSGHLTVQQLVQHTGHLFFTVIGRNKNKKAFRHRASLLNKIF